MKFYTKRARNRSISARALLFASGTTLVCVPTSVAEDQTKFEETIIVTARQSPENIIEVPFAVSVIGQDEIRKRGLSDIEEAIKSVPGVDINSAGQPTLTNVRIRGVGTILLGNRNDASVSIIVDGVPTTTENAAISTLDISRIEVLKGPQSILYGQNSTAGAVNITTNRPTENFEASVRARYGEESQYLAEGTISGPIVDGLKGRIAVRQTGADHWVTNANTGDPITDITTFSGRGQLLWDAAETEFLLSGEYHEFDGFAGVQILRPYGDDPLYDVAPGRFEDNDKSINRVALQIERDLPLGTFTSVSSYTSYKINNEVAFGRNLNGTLFGFPVESVQNQFTEDETISQELRLASSVESPIFWITGLSFLQSKRSHNIVNVGAPNSSDNELESLSYGLYGEITYPLTDQLSLTGGARYSIDEKEFSGRYETGVLPIFEQRELDDEYFTGRVALTYKVSTDASLYALASRGYKSGGFNEFSTSVADSEPFREAVVNTIETGFKLANRDYDVLLNGAIFYNDVADDQVGVFDPFTFASFALNVDTESIGAELDGVWRVNENLSLSGAVAYVDAQIKTSTTTGTVGDISKGNATPDTPEWSGSFGFDWEQDLFGIPYLSDAAFEASLIYRYQGERSADAANNFDLNAYGKLDARLGISHDRGRIYLWGDNLLDEEYDLYGFSFGFPGSETGGPARRRTVGAGIDIIF